MRMGDNGHTTDPAGSAMSDGQRLAAEQAARVADWSRRASVAAFPGWAPADARNRDRLFASAQPGLGTTLQSGSRHRALRLLAVVGANMRFSDHTFSK